MFVSPAVDMVNLKEDKFSLATTGTARAAVCRERRALQNKLLLASLLDVLDAFSLSESLRIRAFVTKAALDALALLPTLLLSTIFTAKECSRRFPAISTLLHVLNKRLILLLFPASVVFNKGASAMKEKLARLFARCLPRSVRYWVVCDCFGKATTGEHSETVASELTVFQMQERVFNS